MASKNNTYVTCKNVQKMVGVFSFEVLVLTANWKILEIEYTEYTVFKLFPKVSVERPDIVMRNEVFFNCQINQYRRFQIAFLCSRNLRRIHHFNEVPVLQVQTFRVGQATKELEIEN